MKSNPIIWPAVRRIIELTLAAHQDSLRAELVIPVPLHSRRQRERGFNQAEVIGKSISKLLGLPLDRRALLRFKATDRHRAGMDAIDRARSVENAFRVSAPARVAGASILLVDDVYTTGATVNAAASTLIKAGAARVSVFTVARVLGTFGSSHTRDGGRRMGRQPKLSNGEVSD